MSAMAGKDSKVVLVQKKVDEVKVVIDQNIQETIKRGENIHDMEANSVILEEHSKKFEKGATKLSRMMWWRNCGAGTAIVAVILGATALFILVIVYANK
ncbi:MAG: vesicle-associated membrane protein 7B [Hyperionvirus sp.]|uniref:Vesicle-associated membrane protein 7B n=1 Tax=Hyperionvirus sp. TaxID=2487770 RepID=A0A3G5AA94_9VIRU|nr:MAG: vesicle-associated membrane protein 7B [Hyperionvirus sp.]